MLRLPSVLLCLLACLSTAVAVAQESRLSIEARFVPPVAKPGDEVVLEVTCAIESGYHVYGAKDEQPIRLKATLTGGLEAIGAPTVPDGELHAAHGLTNYWLQGTAVLTQRFRVPATAPAEIKLAGLVDYLACTESACDPPAKEPFAAKLAVQGAAAAPPPTPSTSTPTPSLSNLLPGIAGGAAADARIQLTAAFVPATARPGDVVELRLVVAIDDGYHLYGSKDPQPPSLRLLDANGLAPQGAATWPDGEEHRGALETNYWVSGTATMVQRLRVTEQAVTGPLTVRASFDHLACTEELCDPPAKAPVTATLTIEGGAAASSGQPPVVPEPPNRTPAVADPVAADGGKVVLRQPKFSLDGVGDDDLMGSLWSLILLCIGGGLIALVMPCTYPMIPITFSFFTKQADARGGKVLPLALAYGIGIVGIFVLIGVAVGPVITEYAAHWITNLVIGGAFLVFALTLFGFLVLQPPQFVNRIAGNAGRAGGLLGVFLMGATLVISSFTCTAPIVGSLLASVATAGRARVALGMGVFGLTMAAPFVLLALLPGRVKALPKSGEWMNTLKVSLGFIEVAAALKFFSNVDATLGLAWLPREVFLLAWAFVFTLLALYLFGMFGYRAVAVEGVGTARNTAGVASLAFAFYCMFGTMGFALDPVLTAFEPPYRLRAIDEHTIVYDDHAAAMALAAKEKKWVLVNFTGFT